MENRTTEPLWLTASVLLCAALAGVPQVALAMDITKTYAPGTEIPQTITEDNKVLTVKGKEYIDIAPTIESKDVSETRAKTVSAANWNGNASSYFAQEEPATQTDGFAGTIKLSSATASVSASASSTRVVTVTRTDTALTQAEVDALPNTITEQVDGHGLQTFMLQGKNVSPSETGVRLYAVESIYSTTVVDTTPSEYALTATYKGSVSRQVDNGQNVVVTYSDEGNQPVFYDASSQSQQTESPTTQQTEQQPEQQNNPAPLIAIIGIVLLASAALGAGVAVVSSKTKQRKQATAEQAVEEEPLDDEVLEGSDDDIGIFEEESVPPTTEDEVGSIEDNLEEATLVEDTETPEEDLGAEPTTVLPHMRE